MPFAGQDFTGKDGEKVFKGSKGWPLAHGNMMKHVKSLTTTSKIKQAATESICIYIYMETSASPSA